MSKRRAPLPVLFVLALAARASGAEPSKLAPIPKEEAISSHSPYEMGACETCHQRHEAANPGPALKVSNDLCYECHDEFKGSAPVKMEKADHPAVKVACTTCHNPHNARKKRLRM
jgi:predicted CXXCH cytochrome family protein